MIPYYEAFMTTVRRIAQEVGVSITTVSRVLNNHPQVSSATRQAVLAAANQSRYEARVGRKSTSNLAYLYTDAMSLGSAFDAAIMQGMSHGMEAGGFDLLVLSAHRSRKRGESFSQFLMRKGVRGVVIRTTSQTHHLCKEIAAEGFPAVVVGDVIEDSSLKCIDANSARASREAVEHLIDLGHRRIAITLNTVDDYDHQIRLKAYEQALAAAGIQRDRRHVLRVPAFRNAGAVALKQLLAMPNRPTAVFVTDPMVAVGLLHEAHRRHLAIPDELSIVGFDDGDIRFGVFPQMSAVCQDAESLGRAAVEALTCLIRKQPHSAPQTPECWFEVHESTASPQRESEAGDDGFDRPIAI